MYRGWSRRVVSVKELYRTKRKNEPVGEATLECGHTVLVDMLVRPKRRVCFTCRQKEITAWPVPPDARGESGEG